ncbi:MAG: glycerophosphodiester phosphodiesterase [Kineosporiaceae bacterium]
MRFPMFQRHDAGPNGRPMVADLENALLRPERDSDRVRVLGHRGCPTAPGRPENSAAAVAEAMRRGADGVEVDVRLTADDELVCAHNPFVLTSSGERLAVAASTSADLYRAAGRNTLATLADVFDAAQVSAGAQVVVEAKPVSDATVAERTAFALAHLLRLVAGSARVTVSSFDPALLALIRTACADLPVRTALLGDATAPAAAVVWRAHEDGHDEVHLPLASVRRTPQAVETACRLGLSVALWTVNRRRDLRWAAELGVAAVVTDDVPAARSELDSVPASRSAGSCAMAA